MAGLSTTFSTYFLGAAPSPSHRRHHRGNSCALIGAMASSNDDKKNSNKEKISIGDRLLDYIEGGPKLRKWYGAPDQMSRDSRMYEFGGETQEEEQGKDNDVRDHVLVTDGDSMTGQLVLLSLIVKRAQVRALVKNAREFLSAFGSYIEPVVGVVEDKVTLKCALRGVRAVVCPGKVGALADKEVVKGLKHIVLLSQFSVSKAAGGLAGILNARARHQVEQDEAKIQSIGVPCTIIRCATLCDEPGGQKGFLFSEGSARRGTLSKEDAAMVCVKALDFPPQKSLILEVANGGTPIHDWKTVFRGLD